MYIKSVHILFHQFFSHNITLKVINHSLISHVIDIQTVNIKDEIIASLLFEKYTWKFKYYFNADKVTIFPQMIFVICKFITGDPYCDCKCNLFLKVTIK